MSMQKFWDSIVPYRQLFLLAAYICLFALAGMAIHAIIGKAASVSRDRVKVNKENLKNVNVEKVKRTRHGWLIRLVTSPDAVDPAPNGHLVINDGGHEKYIRTFTMVGKPKRTQFAKTFTNLFNFSGCTSSVFLVPISDEEMGRKIDRHITILSAEKHSASGDPNRFRKLSGQESEATMWAQEVENGENKFFHVGFLFSLYADSLQELNKLSDNFYAEALSKNILISSCYGMQAEAYALNGPYAGQVNIRSRTVKKGPIQYVTMDKFSVSTLMNYLQSSFSHKTGVPLGRDMITGNLVFFDLYDKSHDSMTLAIAGKPGSGKSLTIKIMAARQILFGWHYVAIDSQQRKGMSEGEYAALGVAVGGKNYQIRIGAEEIVNPFDLSEIILSEKIAEDSIKEVRTIDLASKIVMLVNDLCSMILASVNKDFDSVNEQTYVRRILTDTAAQLYHDFGITHGDVNSLYERHVETAGGITTGFKRKTLPTITDFYVRILRNNLRNTDVSLKKAYTLIIHGLKDRVRELYYTQGEIRVVTKEEFMNLPIDRDGQRRVQTSHGMEEVVEVHGTRAYYDGQSTISINRDCPFTNFDISLLPEDEKKLARQILMGWVNENFIKKNSERMDSANKLVVILDEAHECFKDPYAVDTIDVTTREARKRHVGIILSTQTLAEYDKNPVTKDILKLMECKFIFKQDYQDRDWLVENLGITTSQANMIVGSLGGSERNMDDEKGRHKGEMCIIDNMRVCFCKVDYLKKTEALVADTDVTAVEKLVRVSKAE